MPNVVITRLLGPCVQYYIVDGDPTELHIEMKTSDVLTVDKTCSDALQLREPDAFSGD